MRWLRRLLMFLAVAFCSATAQGQAPGGLIKEIRIDGLRNSREQKILSVLVSRVGEPYSEEKAGRDHAQLEHLGLFAAILVHPESDGDGIILRIEVREIVPYLPLPSLDISEEDGVSIGAGLRALNFLGTGRLLTASARFGGSTQAEVSTEEPWVRGIAWPRRLEYFYRKRSNDLDQFEENSHEFNLRFGKMLSYSLRLGGLFSFLSMGADKQDITLSDGLP